MNYDTRSPTVMMWGCFADDGRRELVALNGTVTAASVTRQPSPTLCSLSSGAPLVSSGERSAGLRLATLFSRIKPHIENLCGILKKTQSEVRDLQIARPLFIVCPHRTFLLMPLCWKTL